MQHTALILAWLGLAVGGCGGRAKPEAPKQLTAEQYGELPGLKSTPDKRLQEELSRIIEKGHTPALLNQTNVAELDNVAVVLVGLFPENKLASILQQAQRIFPPKTLLLNPGPLQKAINFRKEYDAQRTAARNASTRPQCDFGIQFKAGFLAELKFIDVVWICARLETFQAAESLADEKPDEAIDALESILRLTGCLAAEKHGQTRAEAAFIRTEAFVLLQAIALDEHLTRKHLDRLHEMVRAQLKAWPSDADATIGDRALGLHAYELVRAGLVVELLTPEELEQFRKEGTLKELSAATVRSVDADELYYLEAMRKIIGGCRDPYYVRRELFDAMDDELYRLRKSPKYPVVAARLLLPDVRELHVMQARDRANWEAWAMALALATQRPLPPHQINPLTGEKYLHTKVEKFIKVENFGSGRDDDTSTITLPELRF